MDQFEISTVEMHTGGAPLRIIVSGIPEIGGKTILDKMNYLLANHDDLRKLLILEPRGHSDMFGVYLVKPDIVSADFGCIFIHNEGYSTMCGHGVISLGRYAVDYGLVKQPTSPETRVVMQCPCGPIEAFVEYEDGKSGNVRFLSVPSFLYMKDVKTAVDGYGEILVDICYAGAFYAYVEAGKLGMNIRTSQTKDLVTAACKITDELRSSLKLIHPETQQSLYLYGTIVVNDPEDDYFNNLCVFADKQVDRSPCGSGTVGRITQLFGRGQLALNEPRTVYGPVGSKFIAKVVKQVKCGPYDAIVVEVSGKGHYIGTNTFTIEDGDELGKGFLFR